MIGKRKGVVMNDPIISPWLVYLLFIADGIKEFSVIITILLGTAWVVLTIAKIITSNDEGDHEEVMTVDKKCRGLKMLLVLAMFFAFLFPSRNTLVAIYVAKSITPANVNKAVELGKDIKESVKKDILDIIETINKKEEKK